MLSWCSIIRGPLCTAYLHLYNYSNFVLKIYLLKY